MEKKVKKFIGSIINNKKLRTLVSALIAVIVVLLLVVTAAQKLGNVTVNTMTANVKAYFMSMGSGDGFPYELDAQSLKDIEINNSNFMLLFRDKTMLLTSTAKEIMPKEHKFANPVMKTNGNHVIVYDLDSGKYRIQNVSEIVREDELKFRIMAGAVGKNGNYAVAYYGNDVQSVLDVYTASGKKAFAWNFKSELVSDIALSDNGKYVTVAAFSSTDGKISSKLYVFNIASDKYDSCFDYEGTMLLKVNYIKGENIAVLGDNMYSFIKNGKTRQNDVKFGSDMLHNYAVSEDGFSALVLSKYGSSAKSALHVYNSKNKERFSIDLDKEIKWIDCDDEYTAVLFENEVRTYNKKGKQIGSITFTGEPLQVALDSKKTYVLTSANLQCFDTKGTQKAE